MNITINNQRRVLYVPQEDGTIIGLKFNTTIHPKGRVEFKVTAMKEVAGIDTSIFPVAVPKVAKAIITAWTNQSLDLLKSVPKPTSIIN